MVEENFPKVFAAKTRKSAESILISVGRWSIASVYLNGYLTLGLGKKANQLVFQKSFWRPLPIFQLLVGAFVLSLYGQLGVNEYNDVLNFHFYGFSNIVSTMTTLVCYINLLIVTILRLCAFIYRPCTYDFWTRFVQLFSDCLNIFPFEEMESKLIAIRKSQKKSFITLVIITILNSANMFASFYFNSLSDLKPVGLFGWETKLWMPMFATLPYLTIQLHCGQNIWMTFFLKIYILLIKQIERTLDNWKKKNSHWDKKVLMDLYELQMKLDEATIDFTSHFSSRIIIEALLTILISVSFMFSIIGQPNILVGLVVFSFLFPSLLMICIFFLGVCTQASKLMNASESVNRKIHEIYVSIGQDHYSNVHHNHELQMFELLTHNFVELQIGNYFRLSRITFTAILSASFTYLIILNEFRMQ